MQTALKLKTIVLPGKRIEFPTPELTEGEEVELILLRQESNPTQIETSNSDKLGVLDWLQSLKPVNRTPEEWAEVERELKEEKAAWGD